MSSLHGNPNNMHSVMFPKVVILTAPILQGLLSAYEDLVVVWYLVVCTYVCDTPLCQSCQTFISFDRCSSGGGSHYPWCKLG